MQQPTGAQASTRRTSLWQVMQYEGIMDSLQAAIARNDAPSVHRLVQDLRAAPECTSEADALLESGPHNRAARERMIEIYTSQFRPQQEVPDSVTKPIKKSKKSEIPADPSTKSQWVWQVMHYEGLLDNLKSAMETNNAAKVHSAMEEVREAYNELEDVNEAMGLLEAGRWNNVARERISEAYASQFGLKDGTDTQKDAIDPGPRDLLLDIRKDPFYTGPPHGPGRSPPRVTGVRKDYAAPKKMTLSSYATSVRQPTLSAAGIMKGAMDDARLCRQRTSDLQTAGLLPLDHFLRSNNPTAMDKLRSVLQLRGGGFEIPGCGGSNYGSCGASLCDARVIASGFYGDKVKPTKADKLAFMEHMSEPYKPNHSVIFAINAVLDDLYVSFGLITVDLLASFMNTPLPWPGWIPLANFCLSVMCLQLVLEIYLHSALVDQEIMDGDTVMSVIPFWADDGYNQPHWIEAGWVGTVDIMGDADWRHDTGAFITFDGHTLSCFVSERDFVDLEVTSGLYEYFTTFSNIFNITILGLCVFFAFDTSNGVGGVLIAMRLIKPTFKLYGRQDKATEFRERKENVVGEDEEGEEGEEKA